MERGNYNYAQVLVNVAAVGAQTFSYSIPKEIAEQIEIGHAVHVSFGSKGIVNAFVVGFSDYIPEGIKAKPILEIIDEKPLFTLDYLKLLEWVSNYYCCELQTVLACAVPMKFLAQSKRLVTLIDAQMFKNPTPQEENLINEIQNKPMLATTLQKRLKIPSNKFYTLLRKLKTKGVIEIENILEEKSQKEQFEKYISYLNDVEATKRQKEVLEKLRETGEVRLIDFEKEVKTTRASIKKMADAGLVEISEKGVYRNPLSVFAPDKREDFPKLSEEQAQALRELTKRLKNGNPLYLYGVTGSGKTEIYFNLIKKVLDEGKNILFLAPEIALASQLTHRLANRFGIEDVAIWHSSISDGERYDVWQKLKNDEIRILAGARSAVFAPLKNIGLIVIDEEHESAYKQTTPTPRYDAKTVARKLAQTHGAALLLGSATPDISEFYRAKNSDSLITLSKRFNNAEMAKVIVLNMKTEPKEGKSGIFSRVLAGAIQKNLDDKKQTILLLNRRGFSTFTMCQACQSAVQCPKCSIPLIWHASEGKLKCHYCGYEQDYPKFCPACGSDALRNSGVGIQKAQEAVKNLFPNARVERLDSDVLTKKHEHIEVLKRFRTGDIDILIGTQMIAKGLDNPNVTIVGVISADSSFALPDYRSCERGFQLLTQVAGRAGRGDFSGKVYFQTSNPEFYALKTAQEQDYLSFYEAEIASRLEFDYPPFSQIIRLVLSGENNFRTEKAALEIAMRLFEQVEKRGVSERLIILGPSPCVLSKIRGEHRFQILVKNKLEEKGHMFVTSFLSKIKLPKDLRLIVDVDPSELL